MGTLREEHLRRLAPGLTVDTVIGYGVEPDSCGRIDCNEVGQFRSGEEVLLHVVPASRRR
jgi:hypothetical protein